MANAFAALLLLALSIQAVAQTTAPATQASTTRIDLPSFGISLPVPTGYIRDADSDRSIAYFVPDGAVGQARMPVRFLVIDVRSSGPATLSTAAQIVARQEGMQVSTEPAQWGDRPAVELIAPNPSAHKEPSSVRQLLVDRDGYIYRLAFIATGEYAAQLDAYQEVAKNTLWSPIGSAASGIQSRRPSMVLPNGMFITIPDPFRPRMDAESKHTTTFLAFDLPSKSIVASLLVIPLPPEDKNRTLKSTQQEVEQNLLPSLKAKNPVEWKHESAAVAFARSTLFQTADGSAQLLIALRQDATATVFLLRCPSSVKEPKEFEKALDCIRESILVPYSGSKDSRAK